VPADKRHLQTTCVGTSVGLCRFLAPSCQGRLPLVDGDAENERIASVGDLSCRSLHHIREWKGERQYSANPRRVNEQEETYDNPFVTLPPYIEGSLEQPHVAEPVCRLLILRHTDFVPRVVFVCNVPIRCAEFGQRSAGGDGGAYRRWT
jgi:hypothetical protein